MFSKLLDILYPVSCCDCQRTGSFICPDCFEKIYFLPLPVYPLPCPRYLDQVNALAEYGPPLSKVIYTYKYQGVTAIGEYLSMLLYNTGHIPTAQMISHVPMHATKQQQRGFNQSQVIASKLSLRMNIPHRPLLTKIKTSQPQAQITNKTHRLYHQRGLFAVSPIFEQLTQIPTTVLLIDDVITTGATLNECAKVLKQNGVQKVFGITILHGS